MVNKLDRSRPGTSAQVTFRADQKLLEALEAEVDRLRAERPGGRVQRSDVVRELLGRLLLGTPTPTTVVTPPPMVSSPTTAPPAAGPPTADPSSQQSPTEVLRVPRSRSTLRDKPPAPPSAIATTAPPTPASGESQPQHTGASSRATTATPNDEDDEDDATYEARRLGLPLREHPADVHRAKQEVRKYYLEARLRRNFPRETIARETGIPEEALKAFGHKKWLPLSDEHIRALARWLQQRGVGPTM